MNEEMKAHAQLRAAARLINRALLQLDTANVPCCTCERSTWRNRLHAKLYEQLCGMPDKLLHAATRLEYDTNENTQPTEGYVESAAIERATKGAGR